jgi:hypothetical protein
MAAALELGALLAWAGLLAGAAVLLELEPLEQAVAARAIPAAQAAAAIQFFMRMLPREMRVQELCMSPGPRMPSGPYR